MFLVYIVYVQNVSYDTV